MPIIAPYALFASVFLFLMGSAHYPHNRNVLTNGVPSYAEITSHVTASPDGANAGADVYTFSYMDEAERTHKIERIILYPVPEILDDPLEPILYIDNGGVVFFDEIDRLTVGEDGELTSTAGVDAMSLLAPLLAFGAALYISITTIL